MKRREFLASSWAASASAGWARGGDLGGGQVEKEKTGREFYELRLYHLRRGAKVNVVEDFFREAALPAFNRAGIGPIGVFNVMIGPDSPTLYVLIPYPSLPTIVEVDERLLADAEFQKQGAAFLDAPATDPAYVRVESSLMIAFKGIPKIEVLPGTAEKRQRIFELRSYESHSLKAHRKKVEMFNSGEIGIFRRTGLRPVFFGQTVFGARLPNLAYMLTFPDLEERDKNWAAFMADPEWKKLSATPGYRDYEIVSSITNVILTPTSYSQI